MRKASGLSLISGGSMNSKWFVFAAASGLLLNAGPVLAGEITIPEHHKQALQSQQNLQKAQAEGIDVKVTHAGVDETHPVARALSATVTEGTQSSLPMGIVRPDPNTYSAILTCSTQKPDAKGLNTYITWEGRTQPTKVALGPATTGLKYLSQYRITIAQSKQTGDKVESVGKPQSYEFPLDDGKNLENQVYFRYYGGGTQLEALKDNTVKDDPSPGLGYSHFTLQDISHWNAKLGNVETSQKLDLYLGKKFSKFNTCQQPKGKEYLVCEPVDTYRCSRIYYAF